MKLLDDLNDPQREAVTTTDGPVLILAGAGTGKTRVITRRIAYLLARKLAAPNELLALTFTNKAAAEMRERVAELAGKKRASEVVLSTFHSFCLSILREDIEHLGYRRNFSIATEGDSRTLLRRSIDDLKGVRESFHPGLVAEQIGLLKSSGLDPSPDTPPNGKNETETKYRTWLPEMYSRYQSALRAANSVDFDDLLLLTLQLWREHPRILARHSNRFRYVMVDEYQDTNTVQYELLKILCESHRNLCVVGDDDQSIYAWRGADIRNVLSFEKDFPEAKIVKLEENYRSTRIILAAANDVIANNTKRREKALWTQRDKGRPIDWFVVGDEKDEAHEAVGWLRYIQSKSGARYDDFAILYRSNLQSRPFEIAFQQAKIPYVVVGGQAFFERAEIRDIVAYMKFVENPRDEASALRIVNVPRRGIGDKTLHRLHDLCRERNIGLERGLRELAAAPETNSETAKGITEFLDLVRTYRKKFRDDPHHLSEHVEDLIGRVRYKAELGRTSKSPDHFATRWANVEALIEAVREYERSRPNAKPSDFLDDSLLAATDGRGADKRNGRSAVTLMTMHSAKGLEFPFVFIAGFEDGLIPHLKNATGAAIEEERRLFYVALTRGQRHVTLFETLEREKHGRTAPSKPSRFAAELPEQFLKKRIRASKEMMSKES